MNIIRIKLRKYLKIAAAFSCLFSGLARQLSFAQLNYAPLPFTPKKDLRKSVAINFRQFLMAAVILMLITAVMPLYAYASWIDIGNGVFVTDNYGIYSGNVEGANLLNTNMQIEGVIPTVSIPGSESLEREINQRINDVCNRKLDYARENLARSVSFRYEVKSYFNYGSILIYITTALNQLKEEVVSINYDTQKAALADVWDLLGINASALVNTAVKVEMRRQPDYYNVSFAGVGESIDFYAENGYICVLFDKYEIAPGSRGIVGVIIYMDSIGNALIPRFEYRIKTSQYDLKMLPLDKICSLVGYSVSWNTYTNVLEITNGIETIRCAIDENRYYKLGDPPRSLEASPEVVDGVVYVPISFLDSMLNTVYSVDSEGNIALSYIR